MGIRYKGESIAKYGGRGNSNHAAADSNSFKQLKEQNQEYKRQIKSLKRPKNSEDDADREELDAGYQFGGKASKKKNMFRTSN